MHDLIPVESAGFLANGGAMGALMRAHPWAATPLGLPNTWPQPLRTTVRLMLTSQHAMFIWWGDALTCLYNDAYSAAIGPDRHPLALGQPGRQVWAEIWGVIGPEVEFVMAGRGSTWHKRQLIPITRGKGREDVWWTYSYSPIDDDAAAAGIGGVLVICQDVTAEVKAEQAAAHEAGQLRALFEQAPGFMALLRGPSHVFELANAAYLSLVGREVLGQPVREALPEVEGQGFFELLDRVYATGEAFIARRAGVKLASGREGALDRRFLDFVYQPIRDAAGAVTGIFVEGSDVTEATLMEGSLRASEARQALLLRLMREQRETSDPEAMMLAASEGIGRHLGVNRAGFFDMPHDDALTFTVGWTDGAFNLPTGTFPAGGVGSAYLAAVKQGAVLGIADVTQDPLTAGSAFDKVRARAIIGVPIIRNGRWHAGMYVNHGAVRAWTDEEVALVRAVAEQTWDAVERARDGAALRGSETQFRSVLEQLPVGIVVADGEGRITYANPALKHILRHRTTASPGVHAYGEWGGCHPDGRPYEPEEYPLARGLRGEVVEAELSRYARGDGATAWVRLSGLPLRDGTGHITGALAAVLDVDDTELSRQLMARQQEELERLVAERTGELMAAEETLRQTQKMEAVGQLTGGIAHDFNNMLQGVAGSLEMMRRRLDQGRTADVERYMEAARQAVERAATLTHRLLAFARRQALQSVPVQPNALIKSLEELIRRTAEPAATVELRLDDGIWTVLCDPGQLDSVLLNLAINARDAMPAGGTLTIGTRNVRLAAADVSGHEGASPGEYVEVSVADTGTGMDEATKARAFEPFFTTKPIGQGTGLGLSQLYGFMRQSSGIVRLDSALGRGTTVRLFLPRHDDVQQQAPSMPEMVPVHAGQGETVLLVEDDEAVRAVTAEHLRELGYTVLEAHDGPAALEMLHTGTHVDVLVTDVGLPGGMNGRQVADAARERRQGLPALFITGYTGRALDGQLAPGMEVIGKPFALDALAARMRAMLGASDGARWNAKEEA
jgi:PAS domain S-box-containing protein